MSEKLPTTGQAYSFNTDKLNRPIVYSYDRENPEDRKRIKQSELMEATSTNPEDWTLYNKGVEDGKFEANKDIYGKLETEGFPKSASWGSLYNGDKQAKVLGKYEDGTYLIELTEEVNGRMQHRVPAGELVIVEERADEPEAPAVAEESSDSPEVQSLKDRITELENMVASLQATIEDLKRELAQAKGEVSEDREIKNEFEPGQKVKSWSLYSLKFENDWIVKETFERDGKKYVIITKDGSSNRLKGDPDILESVVPEERLKAWQAEGSGTTPVNDEQTTPAAESEDASVRAETEEPEHKRKWGWLQKARDGAKYTGPMVVIGAMGKFFKGERILGEDDPNLSEEEKEKKRKRRAVIRTLGIAAVFGAGVLTGFLLDDDNSKEIIYRDGDGNGDGSGGGIPTSPEEGTSDSDGMGREHEAGHSYGSGSDHHHHDHDHGGDNANDGSGSGSNNRNGTGDLEGSHTESFNETNGKRYVQSILPENLDQRTVGIGNMEQIVDKESGETIVDHVTYKDNGAYSDDTLQKLHDKGYETQVVQNPINDQDGGPGPSGEVANRWSTIVTKNS